MRLGTRSSIALTALLLGGAAVGCSDSDDDGEASGGTGVAAVTVSVDDNVFEPEQVDLAVGGTVTWEWMGAEPHNVVADDFQSEIQQEGTFERTFDESGSYEYVCTVHPGMEGTVEVSD